MAGKDTQKEAVLPPALTPATRPALGTVLSRLLKVSLAPLQGPVCMCAHISLCVPVCASFSRCVLCSVHFPSLSPSVPSPTQAIFPSVSLPCSFRSDLCTPLPSSFLSLHLCVCVSLPLPPSLFLSAFYPQMLCASAPAAPFHLRPLRKHLLSITMADAPPNPAP